MDFFLSLSSGELLQKVCHFMHLPFLFFLAGVCVCVEGGYGCEGAVLFINSRSPVFLGA